MATTKLSSKGQVIIPIALRAAHNWQAGLELIAVDVDDGILLKPKLPFDSTSLADVAGCLPYTGSAKTQDEIDLAIRKSLKDQWRDRD